MSGSVALFVVGPPGVGKTTAIRALVGLSGPYCMTETETLEIPKPKWTVCGTTALAGHYRGNTFDGGDTVPYTGAREALEYWRAHLLPNAALTIFDGDRFSTQPSLDFIRSTGVAVACVRLLASPETMTARRAHRGSNQNETWIKGRVTKANNFAAKLGAHVVTTECPVRHVVDQIAFVINVARKEAA